MPAGEFSFDITPQDAIDYLSKRQKTELSWHWSDVQKQEHMRAFTVAKMTSATLLDDVRQSLDKAMAEGQSFQEWRKDIIPKLQGVWLGKTYGELWDGMTPAEQADKTPPTPEERDRVIKAGRLETIFRTNMFNAYAAGRYRQLKEDADIYPYWRYVTAKDSAVRPAHRALEGKVFKADDPFWTTHYPPNGFNCRCIVEAVDEYDLEMQNLKVQEGGNTYFDEEKGQAVYRDAEGKDYPCDKGWDYNVGEDTTGNKTLASKQFPPELTKTVREDLKTEAERVKAETEELEKARKQAEEESRRADAAQKAAEQAKKQAETEAKRKAEEQRKAQAEAERKAKEQSQKTETEQKRFVVDVTRPTMPSKHPAKKAAAEEQKRFVVDVTRPDKPSKHQAKKATNDEQKRFVVDVTRPDKPGKHSVKKATADEQKRFVVDVTRPDKPSKHPAKKVAETEAERLKAIANSDKAKELLNRHKIPGVEIYGFNPYKDGYIQETDKHKVADSVETLKKYTERYKNMSEGDYKVISSYAEGVPPVQDSDGRKGYRAIQAVMFDDERRKEALTLPIDELEAKYEPKEEQKKGSSKDTNEEKTKNDIIQKDKDKEYKSPEMVARKLHEALSVRDIEPGIIVFRNSDAKILFNVLYVDEEGQQFVELLDFALQTNDEEFVKKAIFHLNESIVGMCSNKNIDGLLQLLPKGQFNCFLSTSINPHNDFKSKTTMVRSVIEIGKNVKGVYIPAVIKQGKYADQNELLLDVGTPVRIISAKLVDGDIVLHLFVGDEY